MPGVSENIRVRSLVGRFLEHPRIYFFKNAPQDHRVYAGSADLMRRNLYNRVEVVFPILDPRLQRRVERLLMTDLSKNVRAWELDADGEYRPVLPAPDEPVIDSQQIYIQDSFGLDIEVD